MEAKRIGLVIHGGAGTIERSKMTPEKEREYRAGLERALTAGYEILKRGGSSLDATEAAVRVLPEVVCTGPAGGRAAADMFDGGVPEMAASAGAGGVAGAAA